MTDWIKEMQEHSSRENLAAIRKEFQRGVDSDKFPDTRDSWKAFIYGWQGTRKFQAAKRELNSAGPGSYSGAFLCWLIGGMFLAFMALSYFTFPHETLALDRFGWIIAGSIGLIGLGFVFMKRLRRVSGAALDAHRAKWGDPEDEREKGVDE